MHKRTANIVILDNQDSFTYNLVDALATLGHQLAIYRNTVGAGHIAKQLLTSSEPTLLLLSPGPGQPKDAGCMPELISQLAGKVPMLGICLGHQAIAEYHGAHIVRAKQVVHGKASAITHQHPQIFADLPQPLPVARYHSLVASDLPDSVQTIASVEQMPMAILHPQQAMLGLQFHPESILTPRGGKLLGNIINYLLDSPLCHKQQTQ